MRRCPREPSKNPWGGRRKHVILPHNLSMARTGYTGASASKSDRIGRAVVFRNTARASVRATGLYLFVLALTIPVLQPEATWRETLADLGFRPYPPFPRPLVPWHESCLLEVTRATNDHLSHLPPHLLVLPPLSRPEWGYSSLGRFLAYWGSLGV
jgi:hypothetical protein